MSKLPWKVSERGDFVPYVAPKSNERAVIQPPWSIQERLNVDETEQKTQIHVYHGEFGGNEGGAPSGGGGVGADTGPPPVDTSDTTWATSGDPMTVESLQQMFAQRPDGGTVNPRDGSSPQTGYQVAGVQEQLPYSADPAVMAQTVMDHLNANKDLYARSDMQIGWWQDKQGNFVVEPSQTVQGVAAAAYLGVIRNQQEIWNNAANARISAAEATGVNPDGTIFTRDANGNPTDKSFELPGIPTFGTGEFGEANENYRPDPGVYALISGSVNQPGTNGSNPTDLGLSQAVQDKLEVRAEAIPGILSEAHMAQNALDKSQNMTAAQVAYGLCWYGRAHNEAKDIAEKTGTTIQVAAASIAATSAQTKIASNMASARYILGKATSDAVVSVPDAILQQYNTDKGINIQNGLRLSQQDDTRTAAFAVMGMMKADQVLCNTAWGAKANGDPCVAAATFGSDGAGKVIELGLGHVVGDSSTLVTPSTILSPTGAMKERNYVNNIIDPSAAQFITIDTHASTVLSSDPSMKPDVTYGMMLSGPDVKAEGYVGQGIYPLAVQAMQDAAGSFASQQGLDINAIEFQAMTFANDIDNKAGANAGSGGTSQSQQSATHDTVASTIAPLPAPLTPAVQPHDVTDLQEALAIIQAGPKDSALGYVQTTSQEKATNKPADTSNEVFGEGYEEFETDPSAYSWAADNMVFSSKSEKDCKADVATRISANCTASTEDLIAAAGLDRPIMGSTVPPIEQLSAAGKEREAAVSTLIGQWAQTSNDHDPASLAMQEAVKKEFGLTDTKEWQKAGPAQAAITAEHGATLQAFVRAQYNDTQQMLKDQGVTSVQLQRGQSEPPPVTTYTPVAGVQNNPSTNTAQMRPASSWSLSYASASKFGDVMMAAQVPASQILSTPRTGFGCLNEHEMVVLGNVNNATIEDTKENRHG